MAVGVRVRVRVTVIKPCKLLFCKEFRQYGDSTAKYRVNKNLANYYFARHLRQYVTLPLHKITNKLINKTGLNKI